MKEVHRARDVGRAFSLYLYVFTDPEALPTPSFWGFMEASFIGMID